MYNASPLVISVTVIDNDEESERDSILVLLRAKSEFFNNPLALLKNKWEELSVDSTYLVRLVCGNTYLAIVLKFTDHTYGSVFIIGYGLTEPIYANLNNGVWTDKTLAIK